MFAVQDFITLESQATDLKQSTFNEGSTSLQIYRQLSLVAGNNIETIGIHPQATELLKNSQAFDLPAGAVDATIEEAVDSDSAIGEAIFDGDRIEKVLWISPTLPILLGDEIPLAVYQWPDQSIDVALDSGIAVRVVRLAVDGSQLGEVVFDDSKYSSASASPDGMALFGSVNGTPVAAIVDETFSVQEVQLEVPSGATFVEAIGLMTFNGELVYAGSTTGPGDETRVVKWNLLGELIDQSTTTGIFAVKASGRAELVGTAQGGFAVIVYDDDLANMLGIQAGVHALALEIDVLAGRGFTAATLIDVVERDGEIFIGVTGTDANDNAIHGVITGSLTFFPSPWKNQIFAEDVNLVNGVTSSDALLIINELNTAGSRLLTSEDLPLEHRIDPNGSGSLSPTDALLVINLLNDRSNEGEGESASNVFASATDQVFPELIDEIRKKSRFWA